MLLEIFSNCYLWAFWWVKTDRNHVWAIRLCPSFDLRPSTSPTDLWAQNIAIIYRRSSTLLLKYPPSWIARLFPKCVETLYKSNWSIDFYDVRIIAKNLRACSARSETAFLLLPTAQNSATFIGKLLGNLESNLCQSCVNLCVIVYGGICGTCSNNWRVWGLKQYLVSRRPDWWNCSRFQVYPAEIRLHDSSIVPEVRWDSVQIKSIGCSNNWSVWELKKYFLALRPDRWNCSQF